MIPDPQVLAAHLGVGTLVLIVGRERPFLVAVTGSPETKARMVAAYRQAGLPIQIAANVDLADPPNHEYQPPQADGRLDLSAQDSSDGPQQAQACGPRSGRPEEGASQLDEAASAATRRSVQFAERVPNAPLVAAEHGVGRDLSGRPREPGHRGAG